MAKVILGSKIKPGVTAVVKRHGGSVKLASTLLRSVQYGVFTG